MDNSISRELNLSILNTVVKYLNQGKIKLLMQMGFTEEHLKKIQSLSYSQLLHLTNSHVVFLNFKLNVDIFDRLLKATAEIDENNRMQDRAISLGASNEILQKYFALSTTEISTQRQLLNIHVTKGRVRLASNEESCEIWKKWNELIKANPSIEKMDNLARLDAYMIITESMFVFNQNDVLSLTAVINELENR